ncbi:MAG TPA: hypothetical protein VG937_10125 [Polyangiaceae bacterium]|nr:hypothetical protein [Polyangiaceae bacterium]
MASSYEEAVATLYQAAHESFVAERKRLAAELKAGGDKAGATRLLALARPPVSAWAVNQLWWQARDEFEQLFAAAARQRAGERAAAAEHRERLGRLRARAGELLRAAGHAASEGTLRRVTTTLGALSVLGSFDPDAPGALSADRDPPGFDALSLDDAAAFAASAPKAKEERGDVNVVTAASRVNDAGKASTDRASDEKERAAARRAAKAAEAEQRRRQAEEARERERKEAERARRQAERERLVELFERARSEFDACEHAASERRKELRAAEAAAEQARNELNAARARLKDFDRARE